MVNRNAIMLCTDANMIVPAMFVAHAVISQAGARASTFDTVIVTDAEAAGDEEKAWMDANRVLHTLVSFNELRSIFDRSGRLTSATLVKLTLPRLFAGRYDRILYLDSDVTVHADLSGLFALDLQGFPVAANRRGVVFRTEAEQKSTWSHFQQLGMSEPFRYFNSGVMLMDVAQWNGERIAERSLEFIRENPELCPLPDEDSLNAVLNGRFAPLSPAWNMLPRRDVYIPLHNHIDPAIVHYTGHDKPWKRFGAHKPLLPDMEAYRLYETFLATSPWPRWLRTQWNMHDLAAALRTGFDENWRRFRGASVTPAKQETAGYLDRYLRFVSEADFIDVAQGLARRDGSSLRLNR